jgi:[ribosomal protein S18]-alanine N-acetyltransferase
MSDRVRRGGVGDLEGIVALERSTATAPHWATPVYAGILKGQDVEAAAAGPAAALRCLFVAESAESGGQVVGFAVGVMQADRVGDLESVVVEAAMQRMGVGRALCRAVIEWCRARGAIELALEVRAGSVGAVALYRGLGFVAEGRRAGYYSDPDEDAITMRMRL